MKLSPKKELQVLLAIQDLGEASEEELTKRLIESNDSDVEVNELKRYLRRLKAKKLITSSNVDGAVLWKLADIPWQPVADMARVKPVTTMSPDEANKVLEEYQKGRDATPKLPTTNKYRNYHRFEMEFEAVDPILGDRAENGGTFPTVGNGPGIVAACCYI